MLNDKKYDPEKAHFKDTLLHFNRKNSPRTFSVKAPLNIFLMWQKTTQFCNWLMQQCIALGPYYNLTNTP